MKANSKKSWQTGTRSASGANSTKTGSQRPEIRGQTDLQEIPAGEALLDAKDVGKRLKLSPRTVSEMANAGRLPAYRVGIYLRFKWADVEQFITANCKVGGSATGKSS